jgi:acyl dehydratase
MPPREVPVGRDSVIRYCGASGDFNPLHWSDRVAQATGLPGVIAHGMLTMGVAARVLLEWCGDPGAVIAYQSRFARPFAVADEAEPARIEVGAEVVAVDGDQLTIELSVRRDGEELLSRAEARLRWPD